MSEEMPRDLNYMCALSSVGDIIEYNKTIQQSFGACV
jgi:hypothetical protein